MPVGLLTIYLHIPGCRSLKEKRSRLKPLLARLHKEFNISVAEIDQNDTWQNAVIGCAMVSNDHGHLQKSLQKVVLWIDTTWPDVFVSNEKLEIV